MAYVNLVGVAYSSKVELFCRIRDFICKRNGTYDYSSNGIGWTLHDSSYAVDEDNPQVNDYFVIYSPGESGDDDIYVKVTWTSTFIKFSGYLSWDASTHAGSSIVYSTSNSMTSPETDANTMWIYGDLSSVIAIIYNTSGVDYRAGYFGKFNPAYKDVYGTVANCSSTLSAGSDVSITVDAVPTNWAVGKQFFIRTSHNNDMATTKIEKATIKTLSGNIITADLSNSYTAGSKLSDFVGYYSNGSEYFAQTIYALIGPKGTTNRDCSLSQMWLSTTAIDPDYFENRIGMLDCVAVEGSVGATGVLRNIKVTPTQNTEFTSLDVLGEEDGTQWRCFKVYYGKYIAVKEV